MIGTGKVLWRDVALKPVERGFGVTLDGRLIKTPARAPLTLPTQALAEAVAGEWRAQKDTVKPDTMPLTRMSNAAIDKLSAQFDETVGAMAEYTATDLVCFRAASPDGLVARQSNVWGGLLTWLQEAHDLVLVPTVGVIPIPQPEPTLAAFREWIGARTAFSLMGLHDLITLSGSVVIARAVMEGARTVEAGWSAAILDDTWQRDVWGADEEADAVLALKADAFLSAASFVALLEDKDRG